VESSCEFDIEPSGSILILITLIIININNIRKAGRSRVRDPMR
jgi:hypothetical protein